jgi:hypothetical protein
MTTIRIYNICPEWTICICNTVVNELYVILVADVYLYKCLIFNYEIFFPVNIFNLYRNIFIFQLFVGWLMSYLRYLCLFAHTGVQHILCCVFLRLVYPMLPVSLCCVMFFFVLCTVCCPFLCVVLCFSSSCVPYVASFTGFSIFDSIFGIL